MKTTLLIIGGFLLLMSCSPKVTTSITQKNEPLNIVNEVKIYNSELGDNIPDNYDVMGNVSVTDKGFSKNCDSITVINMIKKEAQKAGSSIVLITHHERPSFLKSSCHQMHGLLLKKRENLSKPQLSIEENKNNDKSTNSKHLINTEKSKQRLWPRVKLAANIGYGWRTEDVDDGLKNGASWDVSAGYYFNDNFGFGVVYSYYEAATNLKVKNDYAYSTHKVNDKIYFLGPVLMIRGFNNPKWIFNGDVGFGQIRYKNVYEMDNYDYNGSRNIKTKGNNLGFYTSLGVEYRFVEQIGIGVNVVGLFGSLGKLTVDNGLESNKIDLENNQKIDLNMLRVTLGLRYYFLR